jgi:hypothetical protein
MTEDFSPLILAVLGGVNQNVGSSRIQDSNQIKGCMNSFQSLWITWYIFTLIYHDLLYFWKLMEWNPSFFSCKCIFINKDCEKSDWNPEFLRILHFPLAGHGNSSTSWKVEPQKPPTGKVLKLNMIFHDSTQKNVFQNIKIKLNSIPYLAEWLWSPQWWFSRP